MRVAYSCTHTYIGPSINDVSLKVASNISLVFFFRFRIFFKKSQMINLQNVSFSKVTDTVDFNHKYLSNYFSALISFDNQKNEDAIKFFNSSKFLIKKHDNFLRNKGAWEPIRQIHYFVVEAKFTVHFSLLVISLCPPLLSRALLTFSALTNHIKGRSLVHERRCVLIRAGKVTSASKRSVR